MQTIYTFSYTPAIATGTNTIGVNWRMAYQQPIMLYKGTANTIKIVVFATNQRVVNLTGYEIQVQIVDKETEEHYITRTAIVNSPTSGVGTITFTEAELRNLENRFYHIIARLVLPSDGSSVTTSEILYLDDNYGAFLPIQIENAWNYQPTIISTENGAQVINFRSIGETPDSYTGHAGKLLKVNNAENAVEFSNLTTSNTTISSTTANLTLTFGTQLISLFDNSTDLIHNEGDGGFLQFNDDTHTDDGPRFEIWYGDANATPYDPPGQHSLDFRAAANSYVELASHDLNSFIGVDDIGPFIQTQWQTDPTKAWRFFGDGELRLPNVNSSITSLDGRLSLVLAYNDIRFNRLDNDGSTLHQTIFDTNGDVYFDGDLLPGFFDPDPTPIHSLGSVTHPWKDLYLSNSTIYLGNVPISVDNTGNLTVNGNVVTGGGGNGTGPIQPYVELTNDPFITQSVVLDTSVTVTVPNSGQNGRIDFVITEGPTININDVVISAPGTGYVVGQRYKIWYYDVGGSTFDGNVEFTIDSVGDNGELLTVTNIAFAGGGADNGAGTYLNRSFQLRAWIFDEIDVGLTLARDGNQGIYNSEAETEYNNETHLSPLGTEWNAEGWDDLTGLGTRTYTTWRQALNNQVGNYIVGAELVMHDIINDKYYKFDFTQWNGSNGGYSYTRTEVTDPNYFKKTDNGEEVDIIVPDDGSTLGVAITRNNNQGIFNPLQEEGWDSDVSPVGTLWNIDGWNDLTNIEDRDYTNLYAAFGNGGLGAKIVGTECVMYVPLTDTYYAVKFLSWTQNNNGGGFSYTRKEIDLTQLNQGIKFADGSILKSADDFNRIKSTAIGNRKIEEVSGFKQVSVTSIITTNLTTVTSRAEVNASQIWVDSTTTTIDDIISNPANYNDAYAFEFSLDNTNWYSYDGGYSSTGNERGFNVWPAIGNYNQGDTVYFRYTTGGAPQVWWNKNDLPSGGSNFRGAVIDYHAYTSDGTIIGTIHIVDDDGEENITHTEVSSGGTDIENDDLWYVTSEGQIKYRRIDGESATLKIHWTAKVFYGSELYD